MQPKTRYLRGMTLLLDEALKRVESLPQADQDFIASNILETLDDDQTWSRGFREKSDVLEALAAAALAEHQRGETRPLEELLG